MDQSDPPKHARASDMIWSVMDSTGRVAGADFFAELVRHWPLRSMSPTPSSRNARTRPRPGSARWRSGAETGWSTTSSGSLAGTPCELVIADGAVAYHASRLQTKFPEDRPLVAMGAESYLGVPLLDGSGEVLGHLAVMGDKPMDGAEINGSVLRTCAARACMELQRQRSTSQIAALNQKTPGRCGSIADAARDQQRRRPQSHARRALSGDHHRTSAGDSIRSQHDLSLRQQKKSLRLVAAESSIPSDHFVPGLELGLESSHAGWTFLHQRPFFRPDLAKERQYPGEDILFHEGFRSLIVVPLIVRGTSIGTLNLGSEHPMQYGEPEAELLQEVANQLALSIENMREYQEIGRLKAQLERENIYLREEILGEHNFEEIVGSSTQLTAVLHTIDRVAPTDTTVLVLGETGTGKELVARAIHSRSPRHKHPLVKVNCGAIAAGLIESELFGHVKGAFTGALERRTGRFELADKGTIFLDEVGELPLDMQVKLLRVLQEQEFEPVGSSRTVKVDVRVIAATNRHLEQEVAAGRFRADLYYRLNVLRFGCPRCANGAWTYRSS